MMIGMTTIIKIEFMIINHFKIIKAVVERQLLFFYGYDRI